ncbi:pilus assembly protein [Methylophilus sp.]|uniref:pilus assembly protein n=1 Tax=Methylophilus sp. TaxID=29541 RepID=UPI0040351F60
MNSKFWIQRLIWVCLLLSGVARAEFLDLATMPLQTSGSSDVKPNLMFVLDNSGSMGWDYSPDWANSSSDWLRDNADYNTQYYDPEVIYSPPLTYQGVSMNNQTNFSAVANEVDELGRTKNGTSDLRNNAFYYAFVPGEYCSTPNLTSCVISKVPTGVYTYPADIRWCNSSTAAARRTLSGSQRCQKIRNASATVNDSNTYTSLRRPLATYTLTLTRTASTATVQSIKINNVEILSQTVSSNGSNNTLASDVMSRICQSSYTGNCNVSGNVVSRSSNVLTIDTPAGDPVNPASPIQVTMTGGTFSAQLTIDQTNDIPGSMVYVGISNGASYSAPGKAVKGSDRADCAGTTCTYNEEMINYANWWAYYRTRMQSMKTAASQAFKSLDARYRVGLVTINSPGSNYLAIAPFNSTQKQAWYDKLFAVVANGGTPLRTALSSVGRHFAGKKTLGNDDPVQYACQSNFTLLTTDGYWNDGSNPVRINGSTTIGNLDGGSTPRPQLDSSGKSNTLADVTKYFYDTDIRDSSLSNCNGALGSSVCGTNDDYPKQNMVTMTLGLGIDGTLVYTDDYKNQAMGDFKDITSGAKNWPDPTANEDGTRIDDLWHAAVNANGTYYSASNPKLLRESLAKGLSEIKSVQGASAAAAASSLAPTDGDNFQYVASYQTVKWTGNLESRTVNINSLVTSETAGWCVESVASTACAAPSVEARITGNGSTAIYCKATNSDQSKCDSAGGILGAVLGTSETSSCYVEISGSCNGRLQSQVASNSRKIYFNSNNALVSFTADNLPASQRTALNNGYLALSQMQGLPASDPKIADAAKVNKLVDYLRGNKTYEDNSGNTVAANRLFRERQATLGDISQSAPVYSRVLNATYLDANHKAYKNAMETRLPAVFVGANDGMLHAFNANTGDELWAFIPTPAIANLANLADKEYGANYHTNYVNGSPVVRDVCISGCSGSGAVWRTILVSGLNGGGRGYFALDVTNPSSPTLLWEMHTQNGLNSNLGFSFGNPVVTKMQDGRWVVLVTSGYNNGTYARKLNDGTFVNNSPMGDGGGYLYVLDAYTGSLVKTLATGEGSASNPSGLSKIASFVERMFENNTAVKIYGGDLNGNIWRFDINTNAVNKIATLRDGGGNPQKITTNFELGKVDKNIVVLVGTGKFLEPADLTNTPQNSVYGFKDAGQSTAIGRSQLVAQALTSDRKVLSANRVNFDTGFGWLLDFPSGERVNLDPLLINGILLMPSLVPTSEACSGAGYGWFNYFNYKTGGSVLPSGIVSERLTAPAVGFNIVYDSKGVPHVMATLSDSPTPGETKLGGQMLGRTDPGNVSVIFKQRSNLSYGTKQSWRELIP